MISSMDKIKGKVQTVSGIISAQKLGVTLSHEHCLADISWVFYEPEEEHLKKFAYEPVSFENAGYLRYHHQNNVDNLKLLDEWLAIEELKLFKKAGGDTVVDATNDDMGRDPRAIKRISEITGLNIIMGSGYYVKSTQNLRKMEGLTEEDIAKEIIDDIVNGVNGTDICAGLIGEIGCSWPLEDCEKKVLRASGIAQKETGAPLQIHPGRSEDAVFEIKKILDDVDADLNHTTICHTERTILNPKNRYKLIEDGFYLEYDLFGQEGYYPAKYAVFDIPNDAGRIAQIKDLIKHGFGDRILISYDLACKTRYMKYGGHGYAHIIYNVIPAMRDRNISKEDINNITKENPKRFFAFR